MFWDRFDPTTLNRQGGDVGTQYRSGIYYHTEEQKTKAIASKQKRQSKYSSPIVTEILPAAIWYPAEEYHQNYFVQHPNQGYCMAVVAPKLAKFRAKFKSLIAPNYS